VSLVQSEASDHGVSITKYIIVQYLHKPIFQSIHFNLLRSDNNQELIVVVKNHPFGLLELFLGDQFLGVERGSCDVGVNLISNKAEATCEEVFSIDYTEFSMDFSNITFGYNRLNTD
jgi:hypothetical protein